MSARPHPSAAGYDVIGDIHGHADALRSLLDRLGYRAAGGVWRHPAGRTVVYVGDLIDGGPNPRLVLETVYAMVAVGSAHCVMGNHEFTALLHHTPAVGGGPLVAMSERQMATHEVTLRQLAYPLPAEWERWLRWMQTLPLWYDAGDFRVVHACWDAPSMAYLMRTRVDDSLLRAAAGRGADQRSVSNLLKGPLCRVSAEDKSQVTAAIRLKWWQPMVPGMPLSQAALDPLPPPFAGLPIPGHLAHHAYSPHAPTLVVGHYGKPQGGPFHLAPNIICVDGGISKGGVLAAWQTDRQQFVVV